MKIQEIVDYYYNSDINCLKVSFRLNTDQINQIRETEFDIDDIKQWGYDVVFNESVISESTQFYFEDENEDNFFEEVNEEVLEVDEDSLLEFLNEYYSENPKKLPKTSLF
jgi:uncharacterized protein (UPF0128 family)